MMHGFDFCMLWITSYILITTSIFMVIKYHKINNDYLFALIVTFILNQTFTYCLFGLNNLLLSLISIMSINIFTYILYKETKKIDKNAATVLIPYLVWLVVNLIIFIHVFIIN